MALLPFQESKITSDQARMLIEASDGMFEPLVERYGLLPYRSFDSVYKGLITTILSQQLSDRALHAIINNLPDYYFTSPSWLMEHIKRHEHSAATEGIRLIPFSEAKISALKELLTRFASHELCEEGLRAMSREQRAQVLGSSRGIGPWSLDMAEMFIFEATNIFPLGDQGVQNASMLLMDLYSSTLSRQERLEITASFRDHFKSTEVLTLASFYLWALNGDTAHREDFRGLARHWRPAQLPAHIPAGLATRPATHSSAYASGSASSAAPAAAGTAASDSAAASADSASVPCTSGIPHDGAAASADSASVPCTSGSPHDGTAARPLSAHASSEEASSRKTDPDYGPDCQCLTASGSRAPHPDKRAQNGAMTREASAAEADRDEGRAEGVSRNDAAVHPGLSSCKKSRIRRGGCSSLKLHDNSNGSCRFSLRSDWENLIDPDSTR